MDQRTHARLLPPPAAARGDEAKPLACTLQATAPLPQARQGTRAWRVLARPADASNADDRPVRSLLVLGTDALALWAVRVDRDHHPIYELPPLCDARGDWLTAGVLLRDMARLIGSHGLEVDLGGLQAPVHALTAELLVVADLPPHVRVLAQL